MKQEMNPLNTDGQTSKEHDSGGLDMTMHNTGSERKGMSEMEALPDKASMSDKAVVPDKAAMLHDIEVIRQAVNRSQNLLRRIPLMSGLRPVMLLSGVLLLLFCGGKYLLAVLYGDMAPAYLHTLLNVLLIAGGVVAIVMKITGMLRLARQDDASIDFAGLIRELYNRPFALLAGTAGFLAVGLPVWLSYVGHSPFILPVFGMVMGIMMMGIIAIFDMREMIVGAAWLIVCGYVLLWFMGSINLWLAMALEFSVPMLLMWAFTKRSDPKVAAKGTGKAGGRT